MKPVSFLLFLSFVAASPLPWQSQGALLHFAGCSCDLAGNSTQNHILWPKSQGHESPADTCRRMAARLQRWRHWIDSHPVRREKDIARLFQDGDHPSQVLHIQLPVPTSVLLEVSTKPGEEMDEGSALDPLGSERAHVVCTVIGVQEDSGRIALSDTLVLQVILGSFLMLFIAESFLNLWRRFQARWVGAGIALIRLETEEVFVVDKPGAEN